MKKSSYTEEQIADALKQAETGTPITEVIRRMGVSEQTFYRWNKVMAGWPYAAQRAFGGIVVDLEAVVFGVTGQRRLAGERIANPDRAAGR